MNKPDMTLEEWKHEVAGQADDLHVLLQSPNDDWDLDEVYREMHVLIETSLNLAPTKEERLKFRAIGIQFMIDSLADELK